MITALISKKGGVGKTTTAVNLAAAVAQIGRRVLVIDLDPNAGASISLGVHRHDFGFGAAGLLLGQKSLDEVTRPTETPGLDLIPASVDLRSADVELDKLLAKDRLLHRRLEDARQRYDHVFLDCAPSLGLVTRNALVAADTFLVPVVPHFLAAEGIDQLVASAERLTLSSGTRTRFLGIVLTMVDYRTKVTSRTVMALRHRFGTKVMAVEIRINIRLAEAPAFGRTIYAYDPTSTGALAYGLLADEFLLECARLAPRQVAPQPVPVAPY